jgi:cysteine peptidase C11 family protein
MEAGAMTTQARWTWLVYMAGDNNLEGAGRADLAEMRAVGSSAAVNILVQFDTEEKVTTRYRVEKGKLKVLQKMPGVDCGDPKVLTDFLKWGVKNFPATHYLVDIWNHGGGWENLGADYDYDSLRSLKPGKAGKLARLRRSVFRTTARKIIKRPAGARAIAIDVGSHDYLDNQELRKAVAQAMPGGRRFDIFACDACLMNMIEIAYEMRDTSTLMVGSEETEPGAGWPYRAILKKLAVKPTMDPPELAKIIVTEYGKYFTRTGEASTQSALDLERVGPVAQAVDALALALLADLPKMEAAVSLARDRAQRFDSPEYIDLHDFAGLLAQYLPHEAAVQTSAARVQAAIASAGNGFVIANDTVGKKMARAHGVSIYMPAPGEYSPDYRDLQFSKDARWMRLLETLEGRALNRSA